MNFGRDVVFSADLCYNRVNPKPSFVLSEASNLASRCCPKVRFIEAFPSGGRGTAAISKRRACESF